MRTVAWPGEGGWEELMRQAEKEEIVLVRDGHARALIVPFHDDDVEWLARERDPVFVASIERAREEAGAGNTISHADLKKRLGID